MEHDLVRLLIGYDDPVAGGLREAGPSRWGYPKTRTTSSTTLSGAIRAIAFSKFSP